MLTLAIQQLLTKKLRSALTVLGFGVCVNLYIVVTTVMRFITEDLDLQVQRFTGVLFVQSRGLTGLSGIEWPPISSTISMSEASAVISRPAVDQRPFDHGLLRRPRPAAIPNSATGGAPRRHRTGQGRRLPQRSRSDRRTLQRLPPSRTAPATPHRRPSSESSPPDTSPGLPLSVNRSPDARRTDSHSQRSAARSPSEAPSSKSRASSNPRPTSSSDQPSSSPSKTPNASSKPPTP